MSLAPPFPFLCNKTDARGVAVARQTDRQTSYKYLTSAHFTSPALTQLVCQAPLRRGNELRVDLNPSVRGIFVNFKIKPS